MKKRTYRKIAVKEVDVESLVVDTVGNGFADRVTGKIVDVYELPR